MVIEIAIKDKMYGGVFKQALKEFISTLKDSNDWNKYFLNHTIHLFKRNLIMVVIANHIKFQSMHEPYISYMNESEYFSVSTALENGININCINDNNPQSQHNNSCEYIYLNTKTLAMYNELDV